MVQIPGARRQQQYRPSQPAAVVPVISSHRHQKQNQHPLQHRSSPNHHRQQEATVIAIPASIGAPRGTRRNGGAKGGTGEKPRQEICALLKWASFAINFLIFLASVGCLALGIYLCLKDPRPVNELADVLLNPAFLLTIAGLCSGVVSLFGLFGSLRDNVCLLKLFALCVFLGYVALVVLTFVVFVLFYTDSADGFSIQSIFLYSIKKYHTNRNIADLVDYVQEQLECCGSASTAQGFRDWQLSEQFNCTPVNPYPERCGVPFSCCRRAVVSEAGGNVNPLAPAIRSLQCWQNAQRKPEQDLENDIHTAGCLQPMRALFDKHAVHMGMAVVAIILPVSLGVCLSQCLARQIDYQHYLLTREQRRLDRRERRERRYREQLTSVAVQHHHHHGGGPAAGGSGEKRLSTCLTGEQQHRGSSSDPSPSSSSDPSTSFGVGGIGSLPKRPPPKVPPPPTPRGPDGESLEDAVALATAIAASKREFDREQRRRHKRDASTSFPQGISQFSPQSLSPPGKQHQQQSSSSSKARKTSPPAAASAETDTKKNNKSSRQDPDRKKKLGNNEKTNGSLKPSQNPPISKGQTTQNNSSAEQQKQKRKPDGKENTGGVQQSKNHQSSSPMVQPRTVEPSAPPAPVHYILQQSHFS